MSVFFTVAFEWGLVVGISALSLLASFFAIFLLPEKAEVPQTRTDEPKM